MKQLKDRLQKLLNMLRRYTVMMVIVIFGAMYGFLIYTSGQHAIVEPSETEVNEKFQGASRPKIDEEAAKKLQELEAQNIEIKALFDEARNNPFSE